jgi:hypothetical protein
MAAYILYCMDGPKLERCERFDADSDEDGIAEAVRLRGKSAAELWCGSRRVRVFATSDA